MVQPASKIFDIGSLTQRVSQRYCFADTTTSLEGLDEIPDELELTLEPVEAPLLRSQHESSVPTANDARKPWLLAETRDPIASAGADAHSESGSDGISDRSYATALS